MQVILLSGGAGTRLWPLSNEVRSKQFLKVFRTAEGGRESMAQRMYRMIKSVDQTAGITVAAPKEQVSQIRVQLGNLVDISVEPCRRDTFPAIALAASLLKEKGIAEEEPVVVCPVDPYVHEDYFLCLKRLSEEAASGKCRLALMGIAPDSPSEKFGYIIPEEAGDCAPVREFKEKPSREVAEQYIAQGALWNGGVFAFRLGYLLEVAERELGSADHGYLQDHYAELKKISFDYAVVEKEKSIRVVKFSGEWKDLGTWDTLTEVMSDEAHGYATVVGCENTQVINELGLQMVVMGVKNAVVAATPDGILVVDKATSTALKNYVDAKRPMYERREWGEYRVLNSQRNRDGSCTLVKELVLVPGGHISYQYHEHRTEIWTVSSGEGRLVLGEEESVVTPGCSEVIRPGVKHAVKAVTELHIIEVQLGDELTEEDIVRLDWQW